MQTGLTIAGKYRLNQRIGSGGMASVWSATNVYTERQFAIKIMLPSVARTPEAARRFMMEAKASARINHPNIIEVIDVGQAENGALFMVMELLTGVSLQTALQRQNPPMTVYDFCLVMLDVARALAAAHRSNVIHRDLKPTNIFLHKDRHGIAVPKLLDFGVSKFLEDPNHVHTIAGTVLGSPLYMSPEQATGQPNLDGRTDIFSFGAILFEGLVGYRPYDAPSFNALIVNIATKQPRSIDAAAPHLPENLRQLVKDCLVTNRKKRIATIDDVVDRIGLLVPYIEHDPARLPSPSTLRPELDPDATQALPALVRPSERPPSLTQTTMKNRRRTDRLPPPPRTSTALLLGALAALGLVGIGAAATYALTGSRRAPASDADDPPATTIGSSSSPPGRGAKPAGDAPAASAMAPPARGTGRVSVIASPGWCTVVVDGTKRGLTPLLIDLPVGTHDLQCEAPSGSARSTTVVVTDGATSKYRFALE